MINPDGDNRSPIVTTILLFALLAALLLAMNDFMLGNHELIYAATIFFTLAAFSVAFGYVFFTDATNSVKRMVSVLMALIATLLLVIMAINNNADTSTIRDILKTLSIFLMLVFTFTAFLTAIAKKPVRIQY